jgi:CRISPR-associated protein Cas1
MSTIYLVSKYGRLVRKGQVLEFRVGEDIRNTIFPFKTEQLVIIGKVDITSSAMRLLMNHQIDTVFLSKNGRFAGKLAFQTGKNVFLRQKQFQRIDDTEFRLSLAKSIVMGKLKNQLTFVQRILRKKQNRKITDITDSIKTMIRKAESADNLARLRGYEGMGARHFFSIFKYGFQVDWVNFKGRNMNPPLDPINAVLSFIYTMILYRVDAALETLGLDPYVGYFHTLDYGKRSLAFDLMEEYRTPIGDTLTASLFNLEILKEDDFREVTFDREYNAYPIGESEEDDSAVLQEKKAILLNKDGLTKVITQLERKLDTLYFYPPLARRVNYKELINHQCKHFKRVLTGEETVYKPLVIK